MSGTPVLTEDGFADIEDVCVGDMVWAADPETGEVALKRVVRTFINETQELVHVHVNGEEILCTPEHPFYSPVLGWTAAVHLRAGDILVLVNGEYAVVEQVQHEILEAPISVYNFEVEDFHTYYVGNDGVLVHNMCNKAMGQLSDDALRSFGKPGKNSGFRVVHGSHDEAMAFAMSQTKDLVEYSPGKFVGYNSQGVEFRVFPKFRDNYTSIRIYGISGLKGIKFLWG